MKRGDLYLIMRPGGGDPKRRRVFLVVSRQALIDSKFDGTSPRRHGKIPNIVVELTDPRRVVL